MMFREWAAVIAIALCVGVILFVGTGGLTPKAPACPPQEIVK